MRAFLFNVLKTGLPVALLSAAVGYGLATFAGNFADAQVLRSGATGELPSAKMKVRMPVLLGGLTFGAFVSMEAVATLARNRHGAPAAKLTPKLRATTASGMDSEVEALLNRILAQTEAEALTQTPIPGVSSDAHEPRSLSTTH
jgi:hypothetical protein